MRCCVNCWLPQLLCWCAFSFFWAQMIPALQKQEGRIVFQACTGAGIQSKAIVKPQDKPECPKFNGCRISSVNGALSLSRSCDMRFAEWWRRDSYRSREELEGELAEPFLRFLGDRWCNAPIVSIPLRASWGVLALVSLCCLCCDGLPGT